MPKTVEEASVVEHVWLSNQVRKLVLYAPQIAKEAVSGQFVHLRVADQIDPLLRRPISLSSADAIDGKISLIYRVVGHGTERLSRLSFGEIVDCLGPLGQGFALDAVRPLLIGGGMGIAPLVFLAECLRPAPIEILLGGRTKEELFWTEIFKDNCEQLHITTDDGTLGTKGVTLDILPELLQHGKFDRIYVCGPRPMMEGAAKIAKEFGITCQVSLEAHMACGVGACLSCTCAGKNGKRHKICSDGPVFWAEEVF
ncbi:MAG: dihydroorotate dehydrogenase electron transfer subunit [Pelosinus sp.]|nr:dihydroorotate dehydrogenase electron transfer subunit [Pelosinus sp.]